MGPVARRKLSVSGQYLALEEIYLPFAGTSSGYEAELQVLKWEHNATVKGRESGNPLSPPPFFLPGSGLKRVQNLPSLFTDEKYKDAVYQETVKMDGMAETIYFVCRDTPWYKSLQPLNGRADMPQGRCRSPRLRDDMGFDRGLDAQTRENPRAFRGAPRGTARSRGDDQPSLAQVDETPLPMLSLNDLGPLDMPEQYSNKYFEIRKVPPRPVPASAKKRKRNGARAHKWDDQAYINGDLPKISELEMCRMIGDAKEGAGFIPEPLETLLRQTGLLSLLVPKDKPIIPMCWKKRFDKENIRYKEVVIEVEEEEDDDEIRKSDLAAIILGDVSDTFFYF
ncbi:hypothetical protein PG996_008064 [Apiospora saccharicola]|uniref:Uncharacterized protein n=1 Tax=Apiospora saccharicola TaxID=335842 RepID=A0ABR1UXJ8_9PEZI